MSEITKTPVTPGKIIAVHVAYNSRAAQRGRWPKKPSYFQKATSSAAASGADVVRPAGCELLAFEGEIALVIGKEAKNVPAETAWEYVGAITASNDWGIYDYRAQDKGSNTRSKSRDGYTPIGPELIDAASIDPKAIRIRTWVNGNIAQEAITDDEEMIFPLSQFVADLSQHMTLHPGDVILTGTPAGSTVAQPGDIVEVEVDCPTINGTPSSGRLVSKVVEGPGDFDDTVGMLPQIDDKQKEDAYGTREAAGLDPVDDLGTMDESLRELLMRTPTAGLSAQLRNRGLNQTSIEGVYPQTPGTKMVGVAATLRFLPGREDLFTTYGGGYNAQKRAFDALRPGQVLVIEARGEQGSGTLGDVLALRAQHLGAAGIVTDGGIRDYTPVAEVGLPVFGHAKHPAVLGRKHIPYDSGQPIGCGNATVFPGDIIVGDDDGVIVIPRALAWEVAIDAAKKEIQDEWVAERVAEGHKVDGLFPPVGQWKQAYADYLAANPHLEEAIPAPPNSP
ncbi:fumarylacetoacetate hydrolase family protein [Corynebacterium aquilae]|uniref:fumarylacetoacetate hydrolase family protein n=1 Tax=Corynebacterium aquilae TaxID=203263 RepID=UPI0009515805|nr:fumarylacetoacetate hydrolase family protein [Corynebacterium aquilae]